MAELLSNKCEKAYIAASSFICMVDLTKKQIDLLVTVDSNLTMYKGVLDADVAKLKELVDSTNNKEFSNYFTKTFNDNLKKAVMGIKDAKKEVRKANLTKEEKTTLKDSDKAAIAEFANCTNKADKEWSEKSQKT